jgi:hypothetical protein
MSFKRENKEQALRKKVLSHEGTQGGLLDYVFNMLWRKTSDFETCSLVVIK